MFKYLNTFVNNFYFLKIKKFNTIYDKYIVKWHMILLYFFILLILLPFTFLISYSINLQGYDLFNNLGLYTIYNSLISTFQIAISVIFISLFFGVLPAWIITFYDIPGSKLISVLLILPFAVPSYITAYTYKEFFEMYGIFDRTIYLIIGRHFFIDVLNIYGCIFILSISLYPYIFINSKLSFGYSNCSIINSAYMLSKNKIKSFFYIILPMCRYHIISASLLIFMEVISDFSIVKYFGINTFSRLIFKSWFSFNLPELSVRLSFILLFITTVLFVLESIFFSKNKCYQTVCPIKKYKVKKIWYIPIYFLLLFPFIMGFVIPLLQLIEWVYLSYHSEYLMLSLNDMVNVSFITSFIFIFISVIIIIISLVIAFIFVSYRGIPSIFHNIVNIGYATPPIILALSSLLMFSCIDQFLAYIFNIKNYLFISYSYIPLLFCFIIRFFPLAFQYIYSSFLRQSPSILQSAQSIGSSNLIIFLKVFLPINKQVIFSVFFLVFIELLKELPLSIILAPTQYNTLAIMSFRLIMQDKLFESAWISLGIILISLVSLVFLHKIHTPKYMEYK